MEQRLLLNISHNEIRELKSIPDESGIIGHIIEQYGYKHENHPNTDTLELAITFTRNDVESIYQLPRTEVIDRIKKFLTI